MNTNSMSKRSTHYATVSQALSQLQKRGYTVDFNLKENNLKENLQLGKRNDSIKDEFQIVDVFRYEGETDPADQAIVYAIESTSGLKGVLVTGYGISLDIPSETLTRLSLSRW